MKLLAALSALHQARRRAREDHVPFSEAFAREINNLSHTARRIRPRILAEAAEPRLRDQWDSDE